jgi:surface polysaccharide O-acyltransferase-like enzyme
VTLSLAARLSIKRAGKPIVELSNATFGVFLVHLVLFESLQRLFPAVSAGLSIKVMMLAYAGTLVGSFAVSLASRRIPLLRNIF